jgi:hypothetical protein
MDKDYKKHLIQEILFCNGCLTQGVANHEACYKRYCCLCSEFFESKDGLKTHALHYHKNNWCEHCNSVYMFKNAKLHNH